MATCKDCVHFEICKNFKDNICKSCNERHNEYVINKDGICDNFKEKSKFIELPCAVGDRVYRLFIDSFEPTREIGESTVIDFIIEVKAATDDGIIGYFYFDRIGKTVFLTKEAAEKALKERESKC